MNSTQVHYTIRNTYESTIRIIIDHPLGEDPLQIDVRRGDQVTFPVEVPQGYNLRATSLKGKKTINKRGQPAKILTRRLALVPN